MQDSLLEKVEVEEIWGIGHRLGQALRGHGIQTAKQLTQCDKTWLQKKFSISVARIATELQGTPTLQLEETPPSKKSIISSRSFGQKVTSLEDLREATASFMAIAARKLREQGSAALHLSVFICDKEQGTQSASTSLSIPTSFTPDLIQHAHRLLSHLYTPGSSYKKAGVMLQDFVSAKEIQLDFFAQPRNEKLMKLVDKVNQTHGSGTLFFGAEGTHKSWAPIKKNISPRFTTEWDELLTIEL